MKKSLIAVFSTVLVLVGISESVSSSRPVVREVPNEYRVSKLPKEWGGDINILGDETIPVLQDPPQFSTQSSGHSLAGGWHPAGGISGCNSRINATLTAPSGIVYVGGWFTLCGDVVVNHVAAYDPETDTFQALGNGIGFDDLFDVVHSLAIFDGDLYVGGTFWKAGATHADNIARWDGERWHAVGAEGSGNGIYSGGVYALAASENCLFAGGLLSGAVGVNAGHVACWDGEAWHALGRDGKYGVTGHSSNVHSLTLFGDELYVGGVFTEAGNVPASNVARWDGVRWHALGMGENNGVNDDVYAIAGSENGLYVAGNFSEAGRTSASHVARWDGEFWHALENAGSSGVNDTVYALVVSGNGVYAGGRFSEADGVPASGIAYWNGAGWYAAEMDESQRVNGEIRALAVSNEDVYAAGSFNLGSDMPTSNIARMNEGRWYALEDSDNTGASGGSVNAFAFSGDHLYVGGKFTMIGGVPANNIARWDGESWSALESDGFNGVDGDVYAIEIFDDKVYVGGRFDEAGGLSANYIAYWDDSEWGTLGDGYDNGVSDTVLALAVFEEDLYVGGSFDKAGGEPMGQIVRWDGDVWRLPGDDEDNEIWGPHDSVRAFAVVGDDLYVGGRFWSAGDVAARNIARWDGRNWFALEDGDAVGVWGEFPKTSSAVTALAVSGSDLYVGGWFAEAGDVSALNVAHWDGANWHALDTGWSYDKDDYMWNGLWLAGVEFPRVGSLATAGDKLYMGGHFPNVGGTRTHHIARWDGSRWSSLDLGRRNGASGSTNRLSSEWVGALHAQGDAVYVGGSFVEAGGETSFSIAEFVENPDFRIEPGHTALWRSPERSGEGWILEVLDPDTALFYWFTFDEDGKQRWMMDVGAIDGNRIVFEEVHYTRGGQLGYTDPDKVERPVAGQAVMTFTDCRNGAIEFEAFDQNHVINFERLTWSSGLPCGDDGGSSDDPRAALTGTWYDPAHSGEGFVLQWMANGEALVIWFTYDNDGNQQWIIGTGQPDGEEVVFSDLHVARGARFGGDFDPGDVEREEWGELRLTLGCESGVARWESLHPEFASGQLSIQPLTKPDGLNCN